MNTIELEQKLQYIFGAGREEAERVMREVIEAFEEARDGSGIGRQVRSIMMGGIVTDSADDAIAKLTPVAKMVHDVVLERNKLRRELDEGERQSLVANNANGIIADHSRTIQMLRNRCIEHTRREQELELKIRNVVDEASKIAEPFRLRGKKIDQLQKAVEMYRKRGNWLAEQARENREEYTGACKTIVQMYEAATGRKIGLSGILSTPVNDMAKVRNEAGAVMRVLDRVVEKIDNRRRAYGRHDAPPATLLRDVLVDIKDIIDAERANHPATERLQGLAPRMSFEPGTVHMVEDPRLAGVKRRTTFAAADLAPTSDCPTDGCKELDSHTHVEWPKLLKQGSIYAIGALPVGSFVKFGDAYVKKILEKDGYRVLCRGGGDHHPWAYASSHLATLVSLPRDYGQGTEITMPPCKACDIEQGRQGRIPGFDAIHVEPGLHTCARFKAPGAFNR